MTPDKPTEQELRALKHRDPVLGEAIDELEGRHPFPGFPVDILAEMSEFNALARAIVYQQLADAAARTIYGRVEALGDDGFPEPVELLAIPEEELRGAGLSRSKLKAIRDLARKVEAGELDLERLPELSDDEVVEQLTTVWGIGEWTARMHLIFKLGRLDVMPTGDLGIREGVRVLDGLQERPSPSEVLERSEPWRPLRSVASWYLWRLLE